MAEKNGDGIVYHCSDCSPGYVRSYGAGGDWPGSVCGTWGLTDKALQYIHAHPEINHRFEDIAAMTLEEEVEPVAKDFFGDIGKVLEPVFSDPISVIEPILDPIVDIGEKIGEGVQEGYQVVEAGVIDAYKWVDANACNIGVSAAITAGCVALFTPAQPQGAATSTTLSAMAQPLLWATDKAVKVAVVAAMSTVIKDAFLLIPEVANSIDETLLYNIISNCLAASLDSAALWATPAGVGIAIGAAFAPVLANLICNKTCPEGFTKAFGS